MKLSKEELENIEFFASNMMSASEVSMITGVDKYNEEFQSTYWKAWYKTEALINEKIIKLALSGSGTAQQMAKSIIKQKS